VRTNTRVKRSSAKANKRTEAFPSCSSEKKSSWGGRVTPQEHFGAKKSSLFWALNSRRKQGTESVNASAAGHGLQEASRKKIQLGKGKKSRVQYAEDDAYCRCRVSKFWTRKRRKKQFLGQGRWRPFEWGCDFLAETGDDGWHLDVIPRGKSPANVSWSGGQHTVS